MTVFSVTSTTRGSRVLLTDRQTEILRALVNQIIPADDFPGGWEGGLGNYLAKQFERDLAPLLEMYALGLEALDMEALML